MSRGSRNRHSILLSLFRNQPGAAAHDNKGQICAGLGVPQISELNNLSWSWVREFLMKRFLARKKKKSNIDLVEQNLLAEMY